MFYVVNIIFFYCYFFVVCEIFKFLMLKSDRCEKISEYLIKLSESYKLRWRKNRIFVFQLLDFSEIFWEVKQKMMWDWKF